MAEASKTVVVFGASGRTGQKVVEEALASGYEVVAFVRNPSKLPIQHPRLRAATGDATDAEAVSRALEGAEAVISALGQAPGSPKDLLTRAGHHILEGMKRHGIRRFVTLTGAGVSDPADGPPSLGRRFMLGLMKRIVPHVLEDAQRHADEVRASGLDWTIARPPRLTDGPKTTGYRAGSFSLGPGAKLSRADLGHFLVSQLTSKEFVHKAPVVSS